MKWLKIFLIWVSFIPLAILNGGCREYFFVSWLGYPLATTLSGVILGFLIALVTAILLPRVKSLSRRDLLMTSIIWLLLTIGFEFSFGIAGGASFEELLIAYNPMTGNLWLLVLGVTFGAPLLLYRR